MFKMAETIYLKKGLMMKTSTIAMLSLGLSLTACANKKAAPGASEAYREKIVLGEYKDERIASTFDESKLMDLPRVVNFSDEMSPVKNQGNRGTCTFFSVVALMEDAIKRDLGLEVNLSEEYANYIAKDSGYAANKEGSHPYYNIKAIEKSGILLERDLSYQPSWFDYGLQCEKFDPKGVDTPSVCYSHEALDQKTQAKVMSADGIKFGYVKKNTNEIISFLNEYRRPLTVGIPINFDGVPDSGEVTFNEKFAEFCQKNPKSCGLHQIVLTGYDLDRKVYFFKNSWGVEWGKKGFGEIGIEVIDRYLDDGLYYSVANKIDLPADYKEDRLEAKDFTITPVINPDGAVDVTLKGSLLETAGRFIYITTGLATFKKGTPEDATANNDNADLLFLSDERADVVGDVAVRAVKFLNPSSHSSFLWDEGNQPLVLTIGPKLMDLTEAQDLMASQKALLRTSIYVHTDNQGYRVLKREFMPLKSSK